MRRRYDGPQRDGLIIPRLAPVKPTSTLLFAAGAAPGRVTQADEMRVLLINRIAEEFGKGLKQSRRRRLADFVIDKAFEAVPPGGTIGKDTVGHLEMQAREKAKHLSTLPPTPPRTLEGQLAHGRSEREERKVLELRKERKKAIKAVESIGTTAPPSLVRLRLEIFEAARRRAKEAAQIAAAQAAAEEEDRWRKQFELPDPNSQNGSSQLSSQPPFPPPHPSPSMSDSSAAALRTTRLNIALREAESTLKMRSEALKLISSAAVTKKAEWQYAAEERERQVQLAPSRKASDARQRIRSATLLEEEALIKRKKSMSLLEQAKLDCMRAQEQYDMLHTLIGRDALAKEAESNRKKQSAAETEKRREQMGLAKKTSISSTAEARRLRSISAPPPLPGPDGSRPEREIEAIKRDDLMNAFKNSSDYLNRRADAVERQAISDSWRNSISGSASRTSTFLGSEDDTIEYLGVNVDAGLPGDEFLIPSAMEQQRRARATAAASHAVNALLPLPRNLRPRTDAAYEAALREAASERVKEINMKAKAKDQAIKDYVNASRASQRLGGMAPDATAVMLAVEGVVVPPIPPPHKPSRRVVKLEQLLAEQKAQDNMTFFQYRGDSQYAQDGEEMAVEGLSVPPAGAPSLASENAQSATRPRRSSASGARYSKWFSSNPIFEVLDLEGIRKRDSHSYQSEEAEKKNDRKSPTSLNVHDSSEEDIPSVETIYETARASLRTETSAFAPTVPAPVLPPPPPPPPTRALSIHPALLSSKLIADSKPLTKADENIKERLYLESSSQTLFSSGHNSAHTVDDSTGHHSAHHSAHAFNIPSSGGGRARDALFVAPPPAPMQAVPRPRMSIVNKNEWQTTEDAAQSAAATQALVKGVKLKKKQSKFTSMGHDREEVIEALISRPSSLGRGRKAGSSTSSFRSFGATSVTLVAPARKARKVNINMVENVSLAPHLGLKPFPTPTPLGFSPVDRENHIISIKPTISETLISLAKPKSITQQPPPVTLTPFHTL